MSKPLLDPSQSKPGQADDQGYRDAHAERRVDGQAAVLQTLEYVTDEPNTVIADGDNGQPFDRFLEAKLEPCTAIHGLQQSSILLLQGDIHHTGANLIRDWRRWKRTAI